MEPFVRTEREVAGAVVVVVVEAGDVVADGEDD